MRSLTVREVVSIDGSSVTLKARHGPRLDLFKILEQWLDEATNREKPRSSDMGTYSD